MFGIYKNPLAQKKRSSKKCTDEIENHQNSKKDNVLFNEIYRLIITFKNMSAFMSKIDNCIFEMYFPFKIFSIWVEL